MPSVGVGGAHGVPFSSGIVSGPNIVSKSPSVSFVMIISSRITLPLSGSYDGGDSSLLSSLAFSMRISPSTLMTISSISFGGVHIRFSYRAVPRSRHSQNAITAYWGSQLTYLISVLNLSKNALIFSHVLCLVLNRAAMSLFYFRLQKYWEMKI